MAEDQLKLEMKKLIYQGFEEGKIDFNPTYK